jgi:hypothetical protein
LCTTGKQRSLHRDGDRRGEALGLGLAVHQLRFVDQYLKTLADIKSLMVSCTVKDGLAEAIGKVSGRLPVLQTQLRNAQARAQVIGDASSSVLLQGVCELMEASVQQLGQELGSLCSTTRRDKDQKAAAEALKTLATQLQTQLSTFKKKLAKKELDTLVGEARKEVVQYYVEDMQADIEGQLYSIMKWSVNISKQATTAKQRTYLRGKVADGKAALQRKIDHYNKFVKSLRPQRHGIIDGEEALCGELPWHYDELAADAGVTFREKMDIAEKYEWRIRCQEQEGLVLEQMAGYVRYYQTLYGQLEQAVEGWAVHVPGCEQLMQHGMLFARAQLQKASAFAGETAGAFKMDASADAPAVQEARAAAQGLAASVVDELGLGGLGAGGGFPRQRVGAEAGAGSGGDTGHVPAAAQAAPYLLTNALRLAKLWLSPALECDDGGDEENDEEGAGSGDDHDAGGLESSDYGVSDDE